MENVKDMSPTISDRIALAVKNHVQSQSFNVQPECDDVAPNMYAQIFLGMVITLVAIATLALGVNKNIRSAAPISSPSPSPLVTKPPEFRRDPEIDQKIARLEEQMKNMRVQIWATIVAINENANLNQMVDNYYHKNKDRKYLRFDENCMLERPPSTMSIPDNLPPQYLKMLKK